MFNKVIGTWNLDETKFDSLKTINCNGIQDTLLKYSNQDENKFSWKLNDASQTVGYSSFLFVATVVTADNRYWTNVKSGYVDLVSTSDSKLEIVAEQANPEPLVEPSKSISKRNSEKKFEMSTSECGSRKSCYVSLKTCDVDPKTCNFVLSWDFDGELINYELTAISNSWVSVVFSQDQYLGDDNLVVCMKEQLSDKVSVIQYYKNASGIELIRLTASENNLINTQASFDLDRLITCKFSRPKESTKKLITDLTKPHFIYIERGSLGELIGAKLGERFQPSEYSIDFANSIYVPNTAASPRSWLIKVHAILGIIAWILLGSIGILLARYYKPLWPNHAVYSFRVWFSFHRPLMVFVTLLTLLSLLFALIEMEWKWSSGGNGLVHAILGIIVIVCSCINPILGALRPKPDSQLRCLYFWCHWLVGTIAYCLAVPCIFIGMDLSKSDIPNWCAWLLFAWVIFHIIVEIVLEVHYCCTFYRLEGNYNEYNYDYVKNKSLPKKHKNAPGYRWKPTLLFIYSIVTSVVVSALIIAIVVFDI